VLEGFDEQGAPRLRPPARPVTLRHLLTHTAGFSYETWDADVVRYMAHAGLPSPRTGKVAALTTPLLFDPGEQWRYGINLEWVGRVIEAVLDEPLDRVLRDRVFEPLGMVNTGHVLTAAQEQRRATMHFRGEDGSLTPSAFRPPVEPEFFAGGGGLFSTAPDYLRFLRMVLNGGALDGVRLLSSSMVAEMGRNQIGSLRAGVLRTIMPAQSRDIDMFPGMPTGWGLGFLINAEPGPNGRAAGSLSWAGLGNTYYWIDPTHDVICVLMTQVLPFGDPDVLDLLGAVERAAYAVARAE
jgi:CubicO group peptidase (beta-lactamase class C family)